MAQLVERLPSTQNVVGSNPAQGSSFFLSRKKGVVFGGGCLLCLVSLNEFTCTDHCPGLPHVQFHVLEDVGEQVVVGVQVRDILFR